MLRFFLLFALFPLLGASAWSSQLADDYVAIAQGVGTIDIGGAAPGALVLTGEKAFPLLRDQDGKIFAAAARSARGRCAAFAHTMAFEPAAHSQGGGGLGRLVNNLLGWLAGEGRRAGLLNGSESMRSVLEGQGFSVETASYDDLSGYDLLLVGSSELFSGPQVSALRRYLNGGGSLLLAGTPWPQNLDGFENTYGANRVLFGAGINYVHAYPWISGTEHSLSPQIPSLLSNVSFALLDIAAHLDGSEPLNASDQQEAARTVRLAMNWLPITFAPVWGGIAELPMDDAGVLISEAEPLNVTARPIAAMMVMAQVRLAEELPVSELQALPAAADFPGQPPADAARATKTMLINGDFTRVLEGFAYGNPRAHAMRGTGIYAVAGESLEVEIPQALISQGLEALIGVHTDDLSRLDTWKRYPRIVRRIPLRAASTEIRSAFGGLVSITIPPGRRLGMFEVNINGGVEAPRYIRGQTSAEEWQRMRREALAPWGEMEGQNYIFSVRSDDLRGVEDPESVVGFWDDVLDASADLAGISRQRSRVERLVLDRQISAGWLHSGYPMMGHLASTAELVDVENVRQNGAWGPFHEIGHNHQWLPFVIDRSTESSVNLWSVYVWEEVLGSSRDNSHEAISPEARQQRLEAHFAAGAPYDAWGPWHGLEFYLMLQEDFGWAPFTAVFLEYYALSGDSIPEDNGEKIDLFCRLMSRQVERNLAPYFGHWNLPLQSCAAEVAELPEWEGNPLLARFGSCGDGLHFAPLEDCDDGNDNDDDDCSNDCKSKPAPPSLTPEPPAVPESCGCSGSGTSLLWMLALLGLRRRPSLGSHPARQ